MSSGALGCSPGLGGCWRWDPALCRPTWWAHACGTPGDGRRAGWLIAPPIAFSLPSRHIVTIPPLPPLPSRAAVRPRATFQPEHGHRWGTWGRGDRSRHRGGPSPEHPSPPRREQGVQQVQHGFLQVPRRCGGQHTVTHPLQRCPRPPQLPPYGPAPPHPRGIAKEVGNGMSVEVGIWDPTEGGMWDLHGCRDVRLSNSGRGR